VAEKTLLDSIGDPADLRAMDPSELPALAEEMRRKICEVVAERGGHLASNLGVVELTIALHRAFDFSKDRLVLDVGHQCYPHKLLTGRSGRFGTLRSKGGLSGFPCPRESPYDLFVTGHASTAISMALGLACADRGAGRRAVAVVGDGAIAGGLAFEGLNCAGQMGMDLLVILNDNEMSINRTVGALARYLSRLRLDPRYNDLRAHLKEIADRLPFVGDLGRRLAETVRHALAPGGVFEALGFRYIGPADGHDIAELEATLRACRELHGPILLHVYTQKGRGFAPAAADPAAYHSAPPYKIRIASEHGSAPTIRRTYTDEFASALCELARSDARVAAVTAAMCDGTGLAEFARRWPSRFYDAGICEAHAVTFAAGLARGGCRPVVALYSSFLQRAYDSVFHDVCLQGELGVVLCVDRAGLVGEDGPTHHGLHDIAFLRTLPNIILAAPRDGPSLAALLRWAVDLGRPVALRYPRAELPADIPPLCGPRGEVELGRGELLAQGEHVAILAYGAAVAEAFAALRELEREGIRVTLADARFAKPVDAELVGRLARSHERILTVEDGALDGGFGSAVMEAAAEYAGRVVRLGVPDRFIAHASRAEQLAECSLDSPGIARAVRELLAGRGEGLTRG